MLHKILSWIIPDFRVYIGGGGGGGGPDPAIAEGQREAKMGRATRSINELFGIYNPENFNEAGQFNALDDINSSPLTYRRWAEQSNLDDPMGRETGDEYDRPDGPQYTSSYGDYLSSQGWVPAAGGYRPADDEPGDPYLGYQAKGFPGPYGGADYGGGSVLGGDPGAAQRAYENAKKRETAYGKNRTDIMDLFTRGLDEQYGFATQAQTYDLARRGLLNGSEDLQAEAGRKRRYDDSLFQLTNTADSSVNKLRAADEDSRSQLLSSIRAGLDRDSAMASATRNLRTNLDLSTGAANATQFTDLFSDLEGLYKLKNYRQGERSGVYNQSSGYFPVGGSPT